MGDEADRSVDRMTNPTFMGHKRDRNYGLSGDELSARSKIQRQAKDHLKRIKEKKAQEKEKQFDNLLEDLDNGEIKF